MAARSARITFHNASDVQFVVSDLPLPQPWPLILAWDKPYLGETASADDLYPTTNADVLVNPSITHNVSTNPLRMFFDSGYTWSPSP